MQHTMGIPPYLITHLVLAANEDVGVLNLSKVLSAGNLHENKATRRVALNYLQLIGIIKTGQTQNLPVSIPIFCYMQHIGFAFKVGRPR